CARRYTFWSGPLDYW
nr:immunoglobulin heavy chain junction region [Macaca mulatta]